MLKIDEKHLENILYDNLHTEEGTNMLKNRGLTFHEGGHSLVLRQVNLGSYGIPDLIYITSNGSWFNITVIELKITPLCHDSMYQLGRYMSAIEHFLKKYNDHKKRVFNVYGKLIVGDFDKGNDILWMDKLLSSDVQILKADYNLDGLIFKNILPANWQYTGAQFNYNKIFSSPSLVSFYRNSYSERIRQKIEWQAIKDAITPTN